MKGPFFNALGNLKLFAASLMAYAIICTMVCIFLVIKIANVPTHLNIYQHNCNGGYDVIDPNTFSPVRLENFVAGEWTKLNSWNRDGSVEAIENMKNERQFFAPQFVQQYKDILTDLNNKGYVDGYILVTIALPTDDNANVKAYKDGWLVKRKFISRFYFNPRAKDDDLKKIDLQKTYAEVTLEQEITFYVVQFPNNAGLAIDRIVDSSVVSDNAKKLKV